MEHANETVTLVGGEHFITIPLKEYNSLLDSAEQLECLEDGGVDNWEWYSESLKPYFKKKYPENYEDDE